MQIAEVLSDLTSLRACGYSEALALVNVNKGTRSSTNQIQNRQTTDISVENGALKRAQDLVSLYYDVKVKHMRGPEPIVGQDLNQARQDVARVLNELSVNK